MEKASRRVGAAQFISLTGLHDELLGVSPAVHHFRSADGVYFTWGKKKRKVSPSECCGTYLHHLVEH